MIQRMYKEPFNNISRHFYNWILSTYTVIKSQCEDFQKTCKFYKIPFLFKS